MTTKVFKEVFVIWSANSCKFLQYLDLMYRKNCVTRSRNFQCQRNFSLFQKRKSSFKRFSFHKILLKPAKRIINSKTILLFFSFYLSFAEIPSISLTFRDISKIIITKTSTQIVLAIHWFIINWMFLSKQKTFYKLALLKYQIIFT